MNINKKYLNVTPYKTKRLKNEDIEFLIIHHTAGSNSLPIGIGKGRQASFHYLIKKNGEIFHLVSDDYIAWHTGKSNIGPKNKTRWGRNLNPISLGIELENLGDLKDEYPKEQINALKELSQKIIKQYNIEIKNVLGHKEITTRKIDPSSNFFEGDMVGFRKYLEKKVIKEDKKKIEVKKEENYKKTVNKYLDIKGYKLFNDLKNDGETKKLIEIGLYRLVKKLKTKDLKIRK